MSIRVMSKVWDVSKAEGAKLLILLALADRADEEGHCWPSIAYLAHKARISERQAQRLLRELEVEGAIRVDKRAGRGKTNLYRVVCGLEKVKPVPPIQAGKGEIQNDKKVSSGTEKVKSNNGKVKHMTPDSSIKDSPVKETPIDSSSCEGETAEKQEIEELTSEELSELDRIGVYHDLIPEVTKLVNAKGIGTDELLAMIRYAREHDREGTPGALLMARLRRIRPVKKKTPEDWLGGLTP